MKTKLDENRKRATTINLDTYDCAERKQRLLDIAARADAREGIRQGLEDARKGRTRPAEEFLKEFEAAHGLGFQGHK